MLTNGDEVKLQRNALSVIEAPSGHKENGGDDDDNEGNPFSRETSLGTNFLLRLLSNSLMMFLLHIVSFSLKSKKQILSELSRQRCD